MSTRNIRFPVISGLVVGFAFGFGAALARQTETAPVKVTQLSQRDIVEKLDGTSAMATVSMVTIAPGQKDSAHRHTGPVFGYVLSGEYAHALDDEPIKTYKAGDTFYEPSGALHRVAQNPDSKTETRLLAVILHSRQTKQATVPAKSTR
jgi:quercetin dioxygenase-like cupin family protein